MPDSIESTPAYEAGVDWAHRNRTRLSERFSGKELATQELRGTLFAEAQRRYPSQRESMENELKQTAFVAGAYRRLVNTMPLSQEGLIAVSEAAMEIGAWWGAEYNKQDALEALKSRPTGWWRKKIGDATPLDVVNALSSLWWRKFAKEKGVSRTSKWEILIDTTGAREMAALASVKRITARQDGEYYSFEVDGEYGEFQVMARPVFGPGGVLVQGTGEVVG